MIDMRMGQHYRFEMSDRKVDTQTLLLSIVLAL